ncbi:MAG: hypothetical protein ABIN18_08015 [Pseudomonadota bacterium]
MISRQFELQVFKTKRDEMGLAFSEQPSISDKNTKRTKPKEIKAWGLPLKVMTETLLKTLKKHSYQPTALSLKRKDPFILDETSGVRLGLFFFALKPLRKFSRMEDIITGIERMSDEEAYYWYAKCTNGRNAQRSRKALRILLSEE